MEAEVKLEGWRLASSKSHDMIAQSLIEVKGIRKGRRRARERRGERLLMPHICMSNGGTVR
jgi:hypothetical protein